MTLRAPKWVAVVFAALSAVLIGCEDDEVLDVETPGTDVEVEEDGEVDVDE